jgi:thioredoxin-related protein
MRKSIAMAWMVVLALSLSLGSLRAAEIQWGKNLFQAYEQARYEGKPLVVHIERYENGERPPYCKKMEQETLRSEELGCYAKHAVYVRVDFNSQERSDKQLVDSLKIDTLPVVCILDAQKEQIQEVTRFSGYYTRDEFLADFPQGLVKTVQGIAARNPMPQDAGKARVAEVSASLLAQADEMTKTAADWQRVLLGVADGNVQDPAAVEGAYRKWLLAEQNLAAGYIPMCTVGSKEVNEVAACILKMFRTEVPLCSKLNAKVQEIMKTSDLSRESVRADIRKLVTDANAETEKQIETLKAEVVPAAERLAARYR